MSDEEKPNVVGFLEGEIAEESLPAEIVDNSVGGVLERFARLRLAGTKPADCYVKVFGRGEGLSDWQIKRRAEQVLASDEYASVLVRAREQAGVEIGDTAKRLHEMMKAYILEPLEEAHRAAKKEVADMSENDLRSLVMAHKIHENLSEHLRAVMTPANFERLMNVMAKMREAMGLADEAKKSDVRIMIGNFYGGMGADGRNRRLASLPIAAADWGYDDKQEKVLHRPSYEEGYMKARAEVAGDGGVRCPFGVSQGGDGSSCYGATMYGAAKQ